MPNSERRFPGLYALALARLAEISSSSQTIRFPQVFEKLGSTFCIPKPQIWELLFILRDFGFVEIVPGKGVRILKDLKR